MNKRIFAVCIAASLVIISFGQVTDGEKTLKAVSADTITGWKLGSVFGVNFSQTQLINWAAGGQNSLALNGIFSSFANYRQGKNSWENTLDIGYGLLNQGDDLWVKTNDKLDFSSKYGRKAFSNFYYAALFNFKTQFDVGYKDPKTRADVISNFLAPAYMVGALGLSYQPTTYFSAYLAPATGRLTIVNDTALSVNYGLDAGKKTKTEFGGYARVNFAKNDFKNDWLKNVALATKIDLFANYMDFNGIKDVDVSWETLVALKVNKYISVNFNTHLLWDNGIKFDDGNGSEPKAKIQFKEILGVGFSYKF
ncbi:MAG: DUF3078 domain-containing protein [Prevotellaceae bacterium]|jgi:hypothetical protein|nr:DUF3078 domain-containing protein [Prevotellaceae bacterium]